MCVRVLTLMGLKYRLLQGNYCVLLMCVFWGSADHAKVMKECVCRPVLVPWFCWSSRCLLTPELHPTTCHDYPSL